MSGFWLEGRGSSSISMMTGLAGSPLSSTGEPPGIRKKSGLAGSIERKRGSAVILSELAVSPVIVLLKRALKWKLEAVPFVLKIPLPPPDAVLLTIMVLLI